MYRVIDGTTGSTWGYTGYAGETRIIDIAFSTIEAAAIAAFTWFKRFSRPMLIINGKSSFPNTKLPADPWRWVLSQGDFEQRDIEAAERLHPEDLLKRAGYLMGLNRYKWLFTKGTK